MNLTLSNQALGGFLKTITLKGASFKFTARGMSMSPFICCGDSLVIAPIKKTLKKGDIVAFISSSKDNLIIHRIVHIKNNKFLLKGDNVYNADGYVKKECIYGYVKKVIVFDTLK